ncbi:MAG: cupin domain-containing protein [Betaproteobacteria bacterium]|nr:MAG: cupin domain-containing protein [Betaproteobacteria bacterium]
MRNDSILSLSMWKRPLVGSVIAGAFSVVASAAIAGECPADKRVPDGQGQKMSSAAAKGVTDNVRGSIDLSKEPAAINGRLLRIRQLDIQPGGIVPWHSHGNRPAMIYMVSGEVVEYASNCAVPIVHKAGDVAPEKNGTQHWWQNTGATPVVLISVDVFPVEMKKEEHMM